MSEQNVIFQRTQTGRDEIQQKSHGLTQSERLVLIMIDGVSAYREIRARLPVLSDERFERALEKLRHKELVLEVFMPVEGQEPERIERSIVDRFLQQDPMDPLTIIVHDMDDQFDTGLSENIVPSQEHALREGRAAEATPLADDFPTLIVPASMPRAPASLPGRQEAALDTAHAEMADILAEEVRASRQRRAVQPAQPPQFLQEATVCRPKPELPEEHVLSPLGQVHWGYWLIVSGSSFLLGFALGRMGG